jgi:hypothetical protein
VPVGGDPLLERQLALYLRFRKPPVFFGSRDTATGNSKQVLRKESFSVGSFKNI